MAALSVLSWKACQFAHCAQSNIWAYCSCAEIEGKSAAAEILLNSWIYQREGDQDKV